MNDREQASQLRCLKARDITARPQQRSAGEFANTPRGWVPPVHSRLQVERAAAGSATPDRVRFEGFASVTGQPYTMYDMFGEYEEVVALGAFEQTLAQENLDNPLVLGHDPMRRIAWTLLPDIPLELSEVTDGAVTGLQTVAPKLDMRDPDTAYIVPKLELGLLDEMSFRFTIDAGRWSDDFTQYTIQRVNIHRGDTTIVGYGANPHTKGAGARSQGPSPQAREMLRRSMFDRDRKIA